MAIAKTGRGCPVPVGGEGGSGGCWAALGGAGLLRHQPGMLMGRDAALSPPGDVVGLGYRC